MCVIVVWGVGGGSLGWVWGWAGPESRTDAQRECEHPGGFSPLPLNTWSLWRVVFKDTLWRVVFKDTFYQAAVCAVIPVNLCAAVGFPSLWHFQLVLHRKYKKKKQNQKGELQRELLTCGYLPQVSFGQAGRCGSDGGGTECPQCWVPNAALGASPRLCPCWEEVSLSPGTGLWPWAVKRCLGKGRLFVFPFFFFFPQSRLPPTLIPLFLLLSWFFCCFFLLRLLWWLLFGGSPPFPVLCWDPELSSLSAAWRMSYCAAKNCLKN